MKADYICIMERALSAYTRAHMEGWFATVKQEGLTEHGFPRLAANIGVLLAHGRQPELLPLFLEMMEFCCKSTPHVQAANCFFVRELMSCIWAVEQAGVVSKEDTTRWRGYLSQITTDECYHDSAAKSPTDPLRNCVLFAAISEYFRQQDGLCDATDFIELQLQQQMQWFDENGMYRDHKKSTVNQPIMYDLVARALLSFLFDRGYRGEYYHRLDGYLKEAALLTLKMQSPNGEIAFGGRSNQYLHNEAWLIALYEYEAKRYAREGNALLASAFKAASYRALQALQGWLTKTPIRHIKNRFDTQTRFGCERYAYFDKYMITLATNIYAAYLICDDTIPFTPAADTEPCVFATSVYFHKLFTKAGAMG